MERMAGYFARTGNEEALAEILVTLRDPNIPAANRIRGFTGAAVGLRQGQNS